MELHKIVELYKKEEAYVYGNILQFHRCEKQAYRAFETQRSAGRQMRAYQGSGYMSLHLLNC